MNRDMARHGILLFTFGLYLLAVKEVTQNPISLMPPLIPPPPAFFCVLSRGILILIAGFFAFQILRAYKSSNFLKGWPKWLVKFVVNLIAVLLILFIIWLLPPIPPLPVGSFTVLGIIALIASLLFVAAIFWKRWAGRLEDFLGGQQYSYWLIYWVVYIFSWLKGLFSIPAEAFTFTIAGCVGVVWFVAITIITFRSTRQSSRGFGRVEIFVVQHVESPEEANAP
jgi:peptidoglycan/LPS O-acetylase OafA/YrhL